MDEYQITFDGDDCLPAAGACALVYDPHGLFTFDFDGIDIDAQQWFGDVDATGADDGCDGGPDEIRP